MRTLAGVGLAMGICGCSVTTLTAQGSRVEVAQAAEGCQFLQTLTASEGQNWQSPETNIEAVQAELRNKTAALGGNRLVITSQQLGTGSTGYGQNQGGGCPNCITMMGSAYKCAK